MRDGSGTSPAARARGDDRRRRWTRWTRWDRRGWRRARRVRPFGRGGALLVPNAPGRLVAEHRGRLVGVSLVVLLLLGILVGRLGQLQLVAGSRGAEQAAATNTRTLPLPAVRGRILDRHGVPLVANTTRLAVTMDRRVLTADPVRATESLTAVARLLGRDPAELIGRAHLCGEEGAPPPPSCWNGSPQVPVPVADDVDPVIALSLLERPDLRPGLGVRTSVARVFPAPEGAVAPHVLGYLGRVGKEEVAKANGALTDDDLIGRSGLEATYDTQLRGIPGKQVVAIDPRGLVTTVLSETDPVPGRDLRTSIDAGAHAATERALADAVAAARGRGEAADAAAAVVLGAADGQVVALASLPSYDPAIWTGGISAADYAHLQDPAAGRPLLSRAFEAAAPPASTIKALSVPAAVSAGNALDGTWPCPASLRIGNRDFYNFESTAHPPLSFADALRVSCDTVFYDMAFRSWQAQGGLSQRSDAGDPFVSTARAFGLGTRTGIDLPGETPGSVPGREQRLASWTAQKPELCSRASEGYPEVAATDPERAAYLQQLAVENCADGYLYRAGDAANLSIGQGELAASPLQMAVAYAALANGGTVPTPRIGTVLVDPVTGAEGRLPAPPTRATGVDPAVAGYVATALRSVVTSGTAAAAFVGMPEDWPVAGKTGTAEVYGRGDTSWFVSWAPAGSPRYVVAVMISQGGTGAEGAAPAARVIHEALRARMP